MPAFQFPSWYNAAYDRAAEGEVLPAFQFPSWYNRFKDTHGGKEGLAGLPIPQLVQFSRR